MGATSSLDDMASPAQSLPIPKQRMPHEVTSYDEVQLAPIDRAVRCLDRALEAGLSDEDPNPAALQEARMLLSKVSFWVDYIPDPAAIFAFDGGVEVAWKLEDRHLRLYCAADPKKTYVYASQTEGGKTLNSAITTQVDVFTLADGLRWLQP